MEALNEQKDIYQTTIPSEKGIWLMTASSEGLRSLTLKNDLILTTSTTNDILEEATKQLKSYFAGHLKTFDLPIDFSEHSAHRVKVWKLLLEVPFGKSISYQELSLRYGDIKSIRAVANANGRNPLPIIIPCHRIIGKDGSLTGFSLGLPIKEWLLRLEKHPKYCNTQTTLDFD